MAKTNFSTGTTVSSAWLDSHYLTDGGHKHDGVDADGHAQKIALTNAAEVTGLLPVANIGYPHSFLYGGKCYNGPGLNEISIDVTIAKARNADAVIKVPVTITKKIVAGTGYQVGTGLNGLAAGVVTAVDTVLYVFLLGDNSGAYDIGFDNVDNAVNLLADENCPYTYYRRISSVAVSLVSGDDIQPYPFLHQNNRYIFRSANGQYENGVIISVHNASFSSQDGRYRAFPPSLVPSPQNGGLIEVIYDVYPTVNDDCSILVIPRSMTGGVDSYYKHFLDNGIWMTHNKAGDKVALVGLRGFFQGGTEGFLIDASILPGIVQYRVRGYIEHDPV